MKIARRCLSIHGRVTSGEQCFRYSPALLVALESRLPNWSSSSELLTLVTGNPFTSLTSNFKLTGVVSQLISITPKFGWPISTHSILNSKDLFNTFLQRVHASTKNLLKAYHMCMICICSFHPELSLYLGSTMPETSL